VGPLPSSVALAWIDNSRRLLACVRDATVPLAIDRNEHLIDLCDSLLDVWEAHAHRHMPTTRRKILTHGCEGRFDCVPSRRTELR